MQNTENSKKKYVALATYVVAVLCLLAGLFVPLFNGKSILALQLLDAFKCLLGNGDSASEYAFSMNYVISLFGIEKLTFDLSALLVLIYALVTALALLSFIPVALSVRKEGKVAKRFYYIMEIAALIVLSVFFVVLLQSGMNCYNMVIAVGGTAVALIVLCGLDKGKVSVVKIVLFLLSAISFLALFDFVALLSKQDAYAAFGDKIKLDQAFIGEASGALYLKDLFASKIADVLAQFTTAAGKACCLLAAITATVALVNFFIDVVKLGTGKGGKFSRIVDVARYGLELAAAACTLISALVYKERLGIMLVILMAAVAIQLTISVIRLVLAIVKKSDNERVESDETVESDDEEMQKIAQPEDAADDFAAQPEDDYVSPENDYSAPFEENTETPVDDYVSPEEDAANESAESDGYSTEPEPEYTAPDDYTADYNDGYTTEPESEQPADQPDEQQLDIEDIAVLDRDNDSTYLMSHDEHIEEPVEEQPAEPVYEPENEPVYEPVNEPESETEHIVHRPIFKRDDEEQPVYEPVNEPVIEQEPEKPAAEQAVYQPAIEQELNEQPEQGEIDELDLALQELDEYAEEADEHEEHSEQPAAVDKPEPKPEQPAYPPVQKPLLEDVKSYNPYEKRSNPFRDFEQPAQPYNPYAQQPMRSQQPARPVEKPVQTFKPNADRSGVKPLQPRPIIQEFKPVPPVSEQPRERQTYTLDAVYAGPTDDFIRKLTNDERIEFARTFLEKSQGFLGSIPDYVIGGDNKKFFSATFIYLGRIRGLVSDGLLNKMYKELNML